MAQPHQPIRQGITLESDEFYLFWFRCCTSVLYMHYSSSQPLSSTCTTRWSSDRALPIFSNTKNKCNTTPKLAHQTLLVGVRTPKSKSESQTNTLYPRQRFWVFRGRVTGSVHTVSFRSYVGFGYATLFVHTLQTCQIWENDQHHYVPKKICKSTIVMFLTNARRWPRSLYTLIWDFFGILRQLQI